MGKKILVTGFEPFGSDLYNPSAEAVCAIHPKEDYILKKVILPVAWKDAFTVLSAEWDVFSPDAVLLTGLAGGTDRIRIERIGINLCGAAKDNNGFYPDGSTDHALEKKISPDAPDAYFATYHYDRIRDVLLKENIPCAFSFSAGTYLCNYVLFSSLNKGKKESRDIKIGFIHVPYREGQKENAPYLPLETTVAALELIIANMF